MPNYSGIWTTRQQLQALAASTWPNRPGAPTIGTAEGNNAQASVTFTAPASDGGFAITGYRITSTPGNITATGASSPIDITGLSNGTAYTFTVAAQNTLGYGAESAASNSVTPTANPTSTVEYLVVAGGGGGGWDNAGGGGAGGYRTASGFAVSTGSAITVTVGAGGNGSTGGTGTSGNSSVFSTITSAGGGKGGDNSTAGSSGGSGGGGAYISNAGGAASPAGQGNAGGSGSSSNISGGGGGGAGAAGVDGSSTSNGGVGLQSSITGTSTYYAGGGGGTKRISPAGVGGSGGGGNGAEGINGGNIATAGTANTGGGGGGGAGTQVSSNGGNGGSGIVIIRYANTFNSAAVTTGSPTFTNTGGYKIYTWTSSGSITF